MPQSLPDFFDDEFYGAMNSTVGLALIGLLLIGPAVSRLVEEQIELFFLVIGLLAMTLAGAWRWEVVRHAVEEPCGSRLR